MPKVKLINPLERKNPATNRLEQLPVGFELDVTDAEWTGMKTRRSAELVRDQQAAQPSDVSHVVDVAQAAGNTNAPVAETQIPRGKTGKGNEVT